MNSIGARLITILSVTTGLVWLFAISWIYFSTQAEVGRVLDARLSEAARMVNSMVTNHPGEGAASPGLLDEAPSRLHFNGQSYERQLSCQIWSLDGTLVNRSDGAPTTRLTDNANGFSETLIDGKRWRVYTIDNAALGVRVMIGDNLGIRDQLVHDVIKGLLLPAILLLPLMAGLIWISVRRGLSPLKQMAVTLSNRKANDLRPLPDAKAPREIIPAINSVNGLFRRVEGARERERSFVAFAAHELKTPLSGLKLQAQIALGSNDPDIQETALRQISCGIDRTSRLVRQLLDIAKVDADEHIARDGHVNVGHALQLLSNELLMHTRRFDCVAIDDALFGLTLDISPELFALAARNLLENALSHSPANGTIRCTMSRQPDCVLIAIEDDGPGIPEDEFPHVTERFFRGRGKAAIGSGLGLSIVDLALARANATLILSNRNPGLSAQIVVNADKLRLPAA